MPRSVMDKTNFKDFVTNPYNDSGYLKYNKDGYYEFVEFDNNDFNIPFYYREGFTRKMINNIKLSTYLSKKIEKNIETTKSTKHNIIYDYDSVNDHYNSLVEHKVVGRFHKPKAIQDELFKIRKSRPKKTRKKERKGVG
jgi:hypothetical protein